MPTTVPKENDCTVEVSGAVAGVISIARQKRNVVDVYKKRFCTAGPYRWLFIHWQESARQTVRTLAGTPDYKRSQRERCKVEALFAELKQQIKSRKARLRRLWNVAEQLYLAATAQNLKRLAGRLGRLQSAELIAL